MRDHAPEINAGGADLVAVGTGDVRYAAAFVAETGIDFLVLVDDHARAAQAASVRRSSFIGMFHPRTYKRTVEAWRRGSRVHKSGKRVTQLGATFVIGPGPVVRYVHLDDDSTHHASIPDVLAAARA